MRPEAEAALVQRLKRAPLFAGVEDSFLVDIAAQCRIARFKEGSPLFYQGADAPGLHIILSGKVSIHRDAGSGETVQVAQRGEGDFLGEISLLDGGPATATVVADTEVSALILRPSEFQRFIRSAPQAAMVIMAGLATRLREATDLVVAMRTHTLRQRIAAYLLKQTTEQDIVLIESQRELGERVGGSREAVNRALSELIDLGALLKTPRRSAYRVDRKRLRNHCGRQD